MDIRVSHLAPISEYICNDRQYNEKLYVEDCPSLPLSDPKE